MHEHTDKETAVTTLAYYYVDSKYGGLKRLLYNTSSCQDRYTFLCLMENVATKNSFSEAYGSTNHSCT